MAGTRGRRVARPHTGSSRGEVCSPIGTHRPVVIHNCHRNVLKTRKQYHVIAAVLAYLHTLLAPDYRFDSRIYILTLVLIVFCM